MHASVAGSTGPSQNVCAVFEVDVVEVLALVVLSIFPSQTCEILTSLERFWTVVACGRRRGFCMLSKVGKI